MSLRFIFIVDFVMEV